MKNNVKDIINSELKKLMESNDNFIWEDPNFFNSVQNIETGTKYSGVNTFLLFGKGEYFITVKSAIKHKIDFKGVKTNMVIYWNMFNTIDKETKKEITIPTLRYYTVLNIEECKNVPDKFLNKIKKERSEKNNVIINPIEKYDNMITKNNPVIIESTKNYNYYSSINDHIGMCPKNTFKSTEHYYSTLSHELCHWTGHKTRLNRKLGSEKNAIETANEELYAEIGASLINTYMGVNMTDNNRAYIKSWLKHTDIDLFTALTKAMKIFNYLVKDNNENDENLI